jgi:hypothetical protein
MRFTKTYHFKLLLSLLYFIYLCVIELFLEYFRESPALSRIQQMIPAYGSEPDPWRSGSVTLAETHYSPVYFHYCTILH